MNDFEAQFRSWWLDYRDGSLSLNDWQQLLRNQPGLQRFVRLEREREMAAEKKEAHRALGWR